MDESDNFKRIGDGEQIYSHLEEILGTPTQRMLVFTPHGSAIVGRLLKYGTDPSDYGDIEGFIFREARLIHPDPEKVGSLDEDPNLKFFGGRDGLFIKDAISDSYLFLSGKKLFSSTYVWEDEEVIYQKHGFSEEEWLILAVNLFRPFEEFFPLLTSQKLSLLEKLEAPEEQTGYNLSQAVSIAINAAMVNLVAGKTDLAQKFLNRVYELKSMQSQKILEANGHKSLAEGVLPGQVVEGVCFIDGDEAHRLASEANNLKTTVLNRYDEVKDRLVAALQEMDQLRVEKYHYQSLLELGQTDPAE
jgi:hypothetical protein